MAGFSGGGSNGPDYAQPGEPANPDPLETWLDTDADPDGDGTAQGQYLIYGTDGAWHALSVEDHRSLKNVLEDSHHTYPVPTAGLAADSVTTAKVAADAVTNALIANGAIDTPQLATDAVDTSEIAADAITTALIANGAVDTAQIAANAVGTTELSIDPATQTELNSHAGDAAAHHSPPRVWSQNQSVAEGAENTFNFGPPAWFSPSTDAVTVQPGAGSGLTYDATEPYNTDLIVKSYSMAGDGQVSLRVQNVGVGSHSIGVRFMEAP